jgi:hypothetical protein
MENKELVTQKSIDINAIEKAILKGDLSSLNDGQRLDYMKRLCDHLSIDLLTRPFDLVKNKQTGALQLYSNKGCAEQLRKKHSISIRIVDRQKFDQLYVVTAKAVMPNGREDEATGAVDLSGLTGEMLANAVMRCDTKAKRRVTNSICGLAMLDETEVNDNPQIFAEVGDETAAIPSDLANTGAATSRPEHKPFDGKEYTYKIDFADTEARALIKSKGGKWDGANKVWITRNPIQELEDRKLQQIAEAAAGFDDDDIPDFGTPAEQTDLIK